jgi:hypothetical protein
MPALQPGQIWQDDCYYLNRDTGECERKYLLVLAMDGRDAITAVFTSRSNGLPTHPACWQGHPRCGYYVGALGGVLHKDSWVDFNSVAALEEGDFARYRQTQRIRLLSQTLAPAVFCGVLRCVLGYQDLIRRHSRVIGDLAARLRCP